MLNKLLNTSLMRYFINFPPVRWVIKNVTRQIVRRQVNNVESVTSTPIEKFAAKDLDSTLNAIAVDMVKTLGYVGAMVATYEHGDYLAVRAYYINPRIASKERISEWEQWISKHTGIEISLSNPEVARVYRYDERCYDNLSIRAVEKKDFVIDNNLYSLFTPVVPEFARDIVKGIQLELGIEQVIAVPFFVHNQETPVGNLFVAKRGIFTDHDQRILVAVSRQAAIALESERRRLEIEIMQDMVLKIQSNLEDEKKILSHIVQGVVDHLKFVFALVATFDESDRSLPVRAYAIDPKIASPERVAAWEAQLSELSGKPINIGNSDTTRVFLSDHESIKNLSVQAWMTGDPVFSSSLFDLFTPLVPDTPAVRQVIDEMQNALGISRLVVVPFFLPSETGVGEMVGNLFAATRSQRFTDSDVHLLTTFGQQAAVGIKNARLYKLAEQRREAAQALGKMAFSATASIHELRNHISYSILNLQLLKNLKDYDPAFQEEILSAGPKIIERLQLTSSILAQLHEPWRQNLNKETDVNTCIIRAVDKAIRHQSSIVPITMLQENLPPVFTSPDMLTEAFRAILKYTFVALQDYRKEGEVHVQSSYNPTACEIQIRFKDNGAGIQPEALKHLFEISTENNGIGFGLFWAKEYIHNLKGKIEVKSTIGIGTEFRVILPVI